MSGGGRSAPRPGAVAALIPGVLILTLLGWAVAELHQTFLSGGPLLALDERLTAVTVEHRGGPLTAALRAASWLADLTTVFVAVGALGLVVGLRRRGWRLLWFPALVGAGGLLLSAGVKLLTARERPPADLALVEAIGYAFPSGHALRAIAVFGALALVASTILDGRGPQALVWVVAGTLVVGVGAARIYLGVHWLSDVLGGYLLGGAWLWWAHRCTSPTIPGERTDADADGAAPALRGGP